LSQQVDGDRVGELKRHGQVVVGSYDEQNRLLRYGELDFSYTHHGELFSKCQGTACQQFVYDVFGNLRQVVLDNGQMIDYLVDGRNRRIGKKIDGVLVQGWLYDDQLRILAELDGTNNVVARFVYADGINVPELMEKGGRAYRLIKNQLGSVRLVVDVEDGTIIQKMRYDAWGNVVFDSNPSFQPFGFAGGWYDPQPRLVRFGARDYDASVGRWIAKDPLRFESQGTNLFSYAKAEPVNLLDADGLRCSSPCPNYPAGCGDPPPREGCPKCDKAKIQAAYNNALFMFSWYARGKGQETGQAGPTKTVAFVDCKLRPAPGLPDGWFIWGECSWPPAEFHCSGDACVDFCTCVHEWVHFTDRRAFDLYRWSSPKIAAFFEIPAYAATIRCLAGYL